MPKCELPKSIPLRAQGSNYEANVCELEDHVGEKGLSLNWPKKKLGPQKKLLMQVFLVACYKTFELNPRFCMPCPFAMKGKSEIP